jgi:2,4-dienoyl-CoA reductase-like NADH-dependent reductase (Old Yellow Enzyme family)
LVLYAHPVLDARARATGVEPRVLSDDEVAALVRDFIQAAKLAQRAGFGFVDIKHCHGYLGHEFLSAIDRDGRYGGDLEHRSRFLREVVQGIRREVPELEIAVRLSAYDFVPFEPDDSQVGKPCVAPQPYCHAFGAAATGLDVDLRETKTLLSWLSSMGIELVCITAGSPYYNPHIQRPALFPPSDGYLPPNDPLVDVARQLNVVRELKTSHPELVLVGSGYSYLQEWLPHVAQHEVRTAGVDLVGLGRMMLSYPELPADVLSGKALDRRRICRTFSDCTTAPRMGMVSGCYPLDALYKERPESAELAEAKKQVASRRRGGFLRES